LNLWKGSGGGGGTKAGVRVFNAQGMRGHFLACRQGRDGMMKVRKETNKGGKTNLSL
jgi:hypothetical protein